MSGRGHKNRIEKKCVNCGKLFEVPVSNANRYNNCSLKCKSEFLKGKPTWNKGKKNSQEHLVKYSLSRTGKTIFTGFVMPEYKRIRTSIEYKEWRLQVFVRDNFTCQICNKRGNIEVHHIKSFARHPELRLDVDNSITVCFDCHCDIDEMRRRTKT